MSTFHGNFDGQVVIPGTYTAAGGTTHFNFGYQSGAAQKRVPFSTIPFAPDPDFVDRPEILTWLRNKCARPGARAALVGLGGVGKSQLAIQYAHNVYGAAPQRFVFWVHASTQARFKEAYQSLANRLELPGRLDPQADVLRLVSDWLCDETNGLWTMILDNVDDVETFFPMQKHEQDSSSISLATYLPQSRNGSILITSRNKEVADKLAGGYNNMKEVLAMDETKALHLLRSKLLDTASEEGAEDLLRALDYIPLAITQAAAYINRRSRMTIVRYLDEFRLNDKKREYLLRFDVSNLWREESASNAVMTTWHISFDRIRVKRPSAADLLSLMSLFNAQGIPESTLRTYRRNVKRLDSKDDDDNNNDDADSAFADDFDTLQAYSLVTTTAEPDLCEMHALVQFCTRLWLSSRGELRTWEQTFVNLIAREFPHGDFEDWPKCQQLLPHIEDLYKSELSGAELVNKWAYILDRAAWYVQMALGKYGEAERLNRRALEGREKELGVQSLDTLASVHNLAFVLRYQGKYDEAEKLNRRALEGVEKELGIQHPDTLTSVNNLAGVLRYQGKYDEAEKLNQRALEGREKELGIQHPDTLASVGNLALVLQYQGKYDEAVKLNQRALEGREKELGIQHPDTLMSVNNLALALQHQGKYNEAEKLNRRVLERYEKDLGVQHPFTLTSVSNLAGVLGCQGKYNEAEKLERRVLGAREKELGVQHLDTLMSVHNLAFILQNQGKDDEAEKLNQQALEGLEKELGIQHPVTLTSVNNLAEVLRYQGRYGEAEKLSRRALEGREKELGIQHPDTLTSVNNLAGVLQNRGKYDEAEKLNRRALEGREQELGIQHPDTLMSVNNLAFILRNQGKYDEAEKLNRRALEGYEKELGVHHPDTLTSVSNLARLLQNQGKCEEAEKLGQLVLD